ncbi:MAG: hypothetical protein NT062_27190, partial [Proteobacteria bacterium]|nr:hypothetical protein [Pseudomonadota bacterium]
MNKLITILGLALTACVTLDPISLIVRDRVLGAKVTVDGDPQRAWPAPGEHATVTWITASPGAPPEFAWILAACPAQTRTGIPRCDGPVFASSQARGPVPTLQLAIAADLAAPSVVVLGAICASGTPAIDAQTFVASCDDGSQADLVSQHVFIAHDAATNHHPDVVDAPFTLADAPWEARVEPGCAGLPEVAAGSKKRLLGIAFAASDRETFDAPTPGREELQVSAFVTAGDFAQQYAYVEADDDRAVSPVGVEWLPPG